MPYLAFDLDAKKRAARAAQGLGVAPGAVAWGLLEMWEHSWEARSEFVDGLTLSCCFGADPAVPRVLTAMGFLEPQEDGRFRVRGAERYLRISEAKARGGKARAAAATRAGGGTFQNQQPTSSQPADAGDPTSRKPALSPSTEHRAPEEEKKKNVVNSAHTSASSSHRKANPPTTERAFKVVELNAALDLLGWMVDARAKALPNSIPEDRPPGYESWAASAYRATNGNLERIRGAYRGFLANPYWRKSGCPSGAFFAKWSEFLPDLAAEAPTCVELRPGEDPYADETGIRKAGA